MPVCCGIPFPQAVFVWFRTGELEDQWIRNNGCALPCIVVYLSYFSRNFNPCNCSKRTPGPFRDARVGVSCSVSSAVYLLFCTNGKGELPVECEIVKMQKLVLQTVKQMKYTRRYLNGK